MSVFRQTVDLTGVTTFPTLPQVVSPFEPREIAVRNEESSAADIFLSFDGKEDHSRLSGGQGVTFTQRSKSVWLRRDSAGSPPTRVAVVVES